MPKAKQTVQLCACGCTYQHSLVCPECGKAASADALPIARGKVVGQIRTGHYKRIT